MKKQKTLIKKGNWDVLIILDACRYDYFERYYRQHLEGDLRKVISPASHTSEWRRRTFHNDEFKDVIYISANPYINSRVSVEGFDASRTFDRVVDVWNWGWNEDMGTVPPEEVSKTLKVELEESSNSRIIAHYLQPHAPYLNLRIGSFGEDVPSRNGKSLAWILGKSLSWLERKFFLPLLLSKWIYRLRLASGLGVGSEKEVFARKGLKILRSGYVENLKAVLRQVSNLTSSGVFKGKQVVLTSDHGELLGDRIGSRYNNKNRFSHTTGCKNPKLVEVPWMRLYTK